jgi:hypothetical protein
VDVILVITVVGLALALGAALVLVRRRTDEVYSLDRRLRLSRDEAARATAAATRAERPVSDPLLELLPVGGIRRGAGRRVDRANERAPALLTTRPGRLIGRSDGGIPDVRGAHR